MQWHLRLGSEVIGPVSDAELRELARRGGLTPRTPVSKDSIIWGNAADVPGITFGPLPRPHAGAPATALTPAAQRPSNPLWLIIGVAGGAAGMVLVGFLLLVVIAASSTPQVSDELAWQIAQPTWDYWHAVGAILAASQPAEGARPDQMVATWRRSAASIRALPTVGVDPDAVHCGLELAAVLAELADYTERSNSPAVFVEAFLRGAAGDLFGPMIDAVHQDAAMQQQLNRAQQRLDDTRAVLSSRYGFEFPAL